MRIRGWTTRVAVCIVGAFMMGGCDRPAAQPAGGAGTGAAAAATDASGIRSTLGGVYTAEQAAAGKNVYEGLCISCHAGMGNHTGPVFRATWGGRDLGEMYDFMSQNMPKNDPGSLAPEDYTAVMAYLLQMNGMPAGRTVLPSDVAGLKRIRYDTTSTRQ